MMTDEYQDLRQQVEKLKNIIQQHNNHLIRISQVFPRLTDEEQHQSQYEQRVESELSQLNQRMQNLQAEMTEIQQGLHDPLHWLKLYHHSPEQLGDRVLLVDLTADSLKQSLQGGFAQPATFEKQLNGKYWLISGWITTHGRRFDYLVPKNNIRLNIHILEGVRLHFECNNPDMATAKFTVIRPATVSSLGYGEQWQLEERGQLQFESSGQVENDG
jgi:hypothetical protein